MKLFYQYFKADHMKLRHTCFFPIHFFVPIGVTAIFLIYYSFSGWNPITQLESFYVVIGMGFPILIGLLTAIVSDQDLNAGNYQMMLTFPQRVLTFYSKLSLLIMHGCLAILGTSILFGVGNVIFLQQNQINFSIYFIAVLCLISEAIILYTIHLFLAMRFNKGVTIIVGIVEALLSALLRTGLGDSGWCYLPCSWSTRFILNYINNFVNHQEMEWRCKIAVICCIILSCGVLVLYGLWSARWEGTHTDD